MFLAGKCPVCGPRVCGTRKLHPGHKEPIKNNVTRCIVQVVWATAGVQKKSVVEHRPPFSLN